MYKVLIAAISALAVLSAKTDDFTGTHEVTTDEFTAPKESNDGHPYITSANKKCECSVFNTLHPSLEDKPFILSSKTRVDYCDSAGEIACSKYCVGLALAVPKCLCDTLGRHNDLEVCLYSRICDSETWTYTGYFCQGLANSCSYGNFTSTIIMIYIILCKYLVMFVIL